MACARRKWQTIIFLRVWRVPCPVTELPSEPATLLFSLVPPFPFVPNRETSRRIGSVGCSKLACVYIRIHVCVYIYMYRDKQFSPFVIGPCPAGIKTPSTNEQAVTRAIIRRPHNVLHRAPVCVSVCVCIFSTFILSVCLFH